MPGLMLASEASRADTECDPCSAAFVDARYIQEGWRVAQGGLDQGNTTLAKVDVAFGLDGRALHLPGLLLFARAIHDQGAGVSAGLIGDAQGISNIETIRATRLFELWSEWSPGTRFSLRAGLYDFNSEFDSNATGAVFLNPSHGIGKDISQSGRMGPSIFPVTSFGVRFRWKAAAWSLQTAVLDGVPGDPDHPDRTAVHIDAQDGALLAAEIDREGDRLSRVALGTWYYTASSPQIATTNTAEANSASRSSRGVYALTQVRLYQAAGSDGGLAGFVRVGFADHTVNRFARYSGIGLVYTGVATADDQLGLALARATNGSSYRRAVMLAGIPVASAETNIELTWRFSVRDWLAVQPDVQYIFNPNTDPHLGDALAIGLRFELSASTRQGH